MSPQTCRQVKAIMIITMLGVAEGHRVQPTNRFGEAFESRSAFTKRGGVGTRSNRETSKALDADPGAPVELDVLLRDPAFHEQLEAMAEHMDEFASLMKKKPSVLARAKSMSEEMSLLTADPSSYAGSALPEHMEAMIADPDFQEQAQVFAESMQGSVKANTDFEDELEASRSALSAQEASALVSEKVTEVMADPDFQHRQGRVSGALESLMADSGLQAEAQSIAAYVEQMKGSQDPDIAQKVSEQVDATIANTGFRELASNVVMEMLSAELQESLDSADGIDEADLEELAHIAENPSPELLEAMNEVKTAMGSAGPSLLEVSQSNGQDETKKTAKPLLAALLLMMQQGSAFNLGLGAPGRSLPSLGARSQPAPEARASQVGGSLMREVGPQQRQPPAVQMFQHSEPDRAALTSAEGIRSMMPSLAKALPRQGSGAVMSATDGKKGIDVPLLLCFALWYLGNYYYNISNKLALTASGGAAGFPITISTLQLGVGVLYALFMWIAPDARKKPQISFKDYVATLPVGAMSAGAHAASVFALGAGAVSFAQIVKAAEPAFAAVIGTLAYGASISTAKWLSLIPVIGGVCLASLGELNFAMGALVTAALANVFAAIKGNENKKLMSTPGLSDRIGSVGNQFAITTINAFLFTLPLMLLTEGRKLGQFLTLMKTSPVLLNNVISSGLWFYLYNELATLTIKKTNAVTQSVANTAKRVIVIIVVALVMKESLTPLKLIGSGIGIGGVFLYSIIDKLVEGRRAKKSA